MKQSPPDPSESWDLSFSESWLQEAGHRCKTSKVFLVLRNQTQTSRDVHQHGTVLEREGRNEEPGEEKQDVILRGMTEGLKKRTSPRHCVAWHSGRISFLTLI